MYMEKYIYTHTNVNESTKHRLINYAINNFYYRCYAQIILTVELCISLLKTSLLKLAISLNVTEQLKI